MMRTLTALTAVFLVSAAAAAQAVHVVNVACCQFTDTVSNTKHTTVPAGTTVQWQFLPGQLHTVTSGTGAAAANAGSLFDANLGPATPTFSYTFNTPGFYPYFCRPHELFGMDGDVTVTVPASVVSTGTGCAGSSMQPATLSTTGLPQVGNNSFAFTVTGAPAGAQVLIFLAAAVSPVPIPVAPPNCNLYLDPISLQALLAGGFQPLAATANASGVATFPVGPLLTVGLMGAAGALQAAVIDAGAPAGVVTSNALSIVIGV